jgi:predicted dehydrogenase
MYVQDKDELMSGIGVGVIGASQRGWAAKSHLPALRALDSYELRAVSTTRLESAEATAREYGVPAAYDNYQELIDDPSVELVVVTVKAPDHRGPAEAALDAGKALFVEWPLGVDLAEAEALAKRAEAAGVRTVIGLQGRCAPEIAYLRDLISDGYVGRVLGTSLVGSGAFWTADFQREQGYIFDKANGATLLTVTGLHALDMLQYALGELTEVFGQMTVNYSDLRLADGMAITAPDQVALIGRLQSGAPVSVFYRGGISRGDNLRWEINGTDGDLVVTAAHGNLQTADLVLEGARGADSAVSRLEVPGRYLLPGAPAGPARNLTHLYAAVAEDIRTGATTVPGLGHAVRRHQLIEALETSDRTGVRQPLG